jgi:hypothetical protein
MVSKLTPPKNGVVKKGEPGNGETRYLLNAVVASQIVLIDGLSSMVRQDQSRERERERHIDIYIYICIWICICLYIYI